MAKGSRFEREIAKTLSLWLTDDEDDTQLIRSVQSGGWARRQDRQAGDLAANGPAGKTFRKVYVVECKNRQDFEWRHIWSSTGPNIGDWWDQVCKDAEDFGLVPFLVYRRNYHPTLAGFPPEIVKSLWPDSRALEIKWGGLDHEPLMVLELDDVIDSNPENVIERGRQFLRSG